MKRTGLFAFGALTSLDQRFAVIIVEQIHRFGNPIMNDATRSDASGSDASNQNAGGDTGDNTWVLTPTPALIGSLIAATIGLSILAFTFPFFAMASLPDLGLSPSAELLQRYMAAQLDYRLQNYTVAFAIWGAVLGVCIGLATLSNKRTLAAILSGVAGSVGGAVAAYFTSGAVGRAIETSANQSLLQSGSLHFAVWGAIGAGIGLAIGLVHKGSVASISGGLVGMLAGLFVAAIWNVLGSIAFSNSNLILLLPEPMVERIVWGCAGSVVLALGISMGLKPAAEKPSAEKPTAEKPAAEKPSAG